MLAVVFVIKHKASTMTSATSTATAGQPMTTSLPMTKKRQHLWIHQTVVLDTTSTAPTMFTQTTSPNVNVYQRNSSNSRLRNKSGDESPQPIIKQSSKVFGGKYSSPDISKTSMDEDRPTRLRFTHETLPEEDPVAEGKGKSANGQDTGSIPPPLASPTKRVTFLERVQGFASSPHHRSFDSADEDKFDRRNNQAMSMPARRVRKSKTLDAVMVSSGSISGGGEKSNSPRNHVMEFFNQIRTGPSAPWKSSSSSASTSPSSTAQTDASAQASNRPRAFTLGFRSFASFRQHDSTKQVESRKGSRQTVRGDSKEKRKRTQSSSFRAPSWLNGKSKTEQAKPEPRALKPIIRKRSISANNLNWLIMRQTSSEPEIVAALNRTDNAYQEILSNFTCYDLMPPQGTVIGFDIRYTGRQALLAQGQNDVRVALLWDFTSGGVVGVLTATDVLRLLADHKLKSTTVTNTSESSTCCPCGEDVLEKPLMTSLYACTRSKKTKRAVAAVNCEASLRAAVSLLLDNQYHRLAVVNSKTGDILYFLSRRKVLHFLMHHMSTLPTPAALRRTLDDLRLGAWTPSVDDKPEENGNEPPPSRKVWSTSVDDTLPRVVEKFLAAGISALPVLDDHRRILDSLAKYDVIYYLTSQVEKDVDLKSVLVEDVLRNRREGFKRTITCPIEMTLSIALERLIKTDTRRVYVTDSDGALRAVITITDVLTFLMA